MTMKISDTIAFLRNLGSKIEAQHPRINYGGCCVYAYIVGEELTKLGYKIEAFTCGYGPDGAGSITNDIETARNAVYQDRHAWQLPSLYDWQDNGVDFHHVGILFPSKKTVWMHDTHKTKKLSSKFDGLIVGKGTLTLKEIKILGENADGWNPDFDRADIPKIKKKVRKEFYEFANS